MKITAISLLIILSNPPSGYANARKAIEAYRKQDYAVAVEHWQQELKDRNSNKAQVYFQLGNCFSRQMDYSQALLFYERSLKENYNQPEVKFNIKVARAKLGLDTENRILFVTDWLKSAAYGLSDEAMKWAIILLSWLIFILAILNRFTSLPFVKRIWRVCLGLIVVLGVKFVLRNYFSDSSQYGVITAENVMGYSLVTLKGNGKPIHPGEKVKVIDQVSSAFQVVTEGDSAFWIHKSDFTVI